MVGLCGRTISENLRLFDERNVSYHPWQVYSIKWLGGEIASYMTFRSLLDSLQQPRAKESVHLPRCYFAGFLGDVEILYVDQERLADFLVSEGVLRKPDLRQGFYCMASPLIYRLI
jgi:hypothetical protein